MGRIAGFLGGTRTKSAILLDMKAMIKRSKSAVHKEIK